MLGVLVLRLRVERGGHYSMFPGKLLHGALFRCIAAYNAPLAGDLHERRVKPFTVGMLRRAGKSCGAVPQTRELNEPHYTAGEKLLLRLTALDEDVLFALLHIPCGTQLAVGKLIFTVEEVLANGQEDTGCVEVEELIAAVLSMEEVTQFRISFRSPTVFRVDNADCAVPRPELIFASLADKWTWQRLPSVLDKAYVRGVAAKLTPLEWRGAGLRIRQSAQKTVPGFMGDFTFRMDRLSAEEREIILLLAQFAPFCGTGRLTAQGFGETQIVFS